MLPAWMVNGTSTTFLTLSTSSGSANLINVIATTTNLLTATPTDGSDCIADRRPREGAAGAAPAQTGHQRMLALLDDIAKKGDELHPFYGKKRLADLRERWAKRGSVASPAERWFLLRRIGKAELEQGNEAESIAALEQAVALVDGLDYDEIARSKVGEDLVSSPDRATYYRNLTWFELGVAYLRFGETQNCCLRNTSESCIMPLRGTALHTVKEGSQGAIRCVEAVLGKRPATADPLEARDCEAPSRWLLNVAYMTLGEYPAGVPEKWRIDLDGLFACDVDFPRIENVIPAL